MNDSSVDTSPFPAHEFAFLAAAESKHWWFRARNNIIVWILRTKVSALDTFLEVGCGTGYVIKRIAAAFPSLSLKASEYYEEGLVYARERVPNCEFKQLDATVMTEHEVYDCIGCFDVIEHIEEDDRVLYNFNRALRPRGYLLLTIPQHAWLWSASDEYAHHVRRYTYKQIWSKLNKNGFKIEYSSSFVSLLLPLMLVQRLFMTSKDYCLEDEFVVNKLLNSFLLLAMKIEFILLCLGVRFPMGGSLIFLARKS